MAKSPLVNSQWILEKVQKMDGQGMDPIDKSSPQAMSSIITLVLVLLLLVLVGPPAPKEERLLIGIISGLVETPLTGALELDFSDIESAEDALLPVEVPLLGPLFPRRFILVVWREGDDDLDCIPFPK